MMDGRVLDTLLSILLVFFYASILLIPLGVWKLFELVAKLF